MKIGEIHLDVLGNQIGLGDYFVVPDRVNEMNVLYLYKVDLSTADDLIFEVVGTIRQGVLDQERPNMSFSFPPSSLCVKVEAPRLSSKYQQEEESLLLRL